MYLRLMAEGFTPLPFAGGSLNELYTCQLALKFIRFLKW